MISKTIGFRGTNHFQTHPYGEHGELSQRTEILRSVRTRSNAAGTDDFLPNSSSASGRPGGESVLPKKRLKFPWEKLVKLSIEVSDFTTITLLRVIPTMTCQDVYLDIFNIF